MLGEQSRILSREESTQSPPAIAVGLVQRRLVPQLLKENALPGEDSTGGALCICSGLR